MLQLRSMVKVYSSPRCKQCELTYKVLDEIGKPYEVIDLAENPEAVEHVKELGYLAAPVVVTGTDHWTGFRPDKLKALA